MCQNNLQFLESIKIQNQEIFLLPYHQQRVSGTFQHFTKGKPPILIENILKKIHLPKDSSPYKLRIAYDLNGNYQTELLPYSINPIQSFELVENPNLDYSFKYENRDFFKILKEKSRAEEIIITQNGKITDTSFSNLIFLKNGAWHTPKNYLLNGVQRQFLLYQNIIKESEISVENIRDFSHFSLINAMRNMDNMEMYPLNFIQNLP